MPRRRAPDEEQAGDGRPRNLGGALRSAWVGYQGRVDEAMAAAGFPDRRFPDGRVLRLCARSEQVTSSRIGRELGMTRQGAAKIVGALVNRGYLALEASPTDGREKVLRLTPRAVEYLAAQRAVVRRIEQDLSDQLGSASFEGLFALLDALGGDEGQLRMRDYLRYAVRYDEGDGSG